MLCWLGEGPCCTWRGTDTWTTTRTGPAATSSPRRGSPATSPAQSETSRSGALEINGSLLTEEVYILKKHLFHPHPDVQAFAGLTPTGELDAVTTELMETPRCGVRDIIGHGAIQRRRKR